MSKRRDTLTPSLFLRTTSRCLHTWRYRAAQFGFYPLFLTQSVGVRGIDSQPFDQPIIEPLTRLAALAAPDLHCPAGRRGQEAVA